MQQRWNDFVCVSGWEYNLYRVLSEVLFFVNMQVGLDEGRMMKLVIRFNDVQKLCLLFNRKLSFINSVGTFHIFSSIMAWWSYLMTVDRVVGALLDQIIH